MGWINQQMQQKTDPDYSGSKNARKNGGHVVNLGEVNQLINCH